MGFCIKPAQTPLTTNKIDKKTQPELHTASLAVLSKMTKEYKGVQIKKAPDSNNHNFTAQKEALLRTAKYDWHND